MPTNPPIAEDLRLLLDRAADRAFELAYIKNSSTYRLSQKARTSGFAKVLSRSPTANVTIRATGERGGPQSAEERGAEVWLLRASANVGEPGVPWQFVRAEGFAPVDSRYSAHGHCLQTPREGEVFFAAGNDPELEFMSHPWSGVVEIEFAGRHERIDLRSECTCNVLVRPARTPMVVATAPAESTGNLPPASPATSSSFTPADEEFLALCARERPTVVAVHCPRWLGISSATRNLYQTRYCVPETAAIEPGHLTDADIERHARVLAESNVPHVVISGGDLTQLRIVERLKELRPQATVDVLYHGSYIQFAERYEWNVVQVWVEAYQRGLIRGIATVKAGMEDFFRAVGVPSALVLNLVPGAPMDPPEVSEEETHVGVWISGVSSRKCPHAMLAALKMMGRTRLHAAGMDERAREMVRAFDIPVGVMEPQPLPHAMLMEAMRTTHLSMYVTFSECCPMLPLESLRMGVPCLLGPVSHLFEDDRFLFERLVVPFPDRADIIAKYATRAALERRDIIKAYAKYVPDYNRRALESASLLVEKGPTLTRGA